MMIGKPYAEQYSVLLRSCAVIYRLSKYFMERFRECEANANSAHLAALRDLNDRQCIIEQIRQRTYAPLWQRACSCGYARAEENRNIESRGRRNVTEQSFVLSRYLVPSRNRQMRYL
jgi:hypothetical protein